MAEEGTLRRAPEELAAMTSTAVRFGILGAARIAPAALIRPARSNAEVTVEVVAARDRDKAVAYATRHRIPRVADSYEAVLDDPDIDAVYIPLPNSLHAEWTLAALAAGKHVLCEKPFTSNAAEAVTVAEAAAGPRPDGAWSCSRRSTTATIRWPTGMREIVESGELGRLHHIETWLCAPIPNKSDIRYQFELAGGAMMDMGSYVVHMARHARRGGAVGDLGHGQAPRRPTSTGPCRPSCSSRAATPPRCTARCGPRRSSIWPPGWSATRASSGCSTRSPPSSSAGSPCGPAAPAASRSRHGGPPTPTSWTRSATRSSEVSRP